MSDERDEEAAARDRAAGTEARHARGLRDQMSDAESQEQDREEAARIA